ncbi:hypothetical protein GF406_13350 [candidate division KSB1 bacterium]|nr:hypothetical protein [candidate division KSB1 bacterium]
MMIEEQIKTRGNIHRKYFRQPGVKTAKPVTAKFSSQTTMSDTTISSQPLLSLKRQFAKNRIIVIAGLALLLIISSIFRPDNTSNIFYYFFFFCFWFGLAILMFLGLEWLYKLYIGLMVGSGLIAIASGFSDNSDTAIVAGAISVTLLALLLAVAAGIFSVLLGPGFLVGNGVNSLLGDNFISGALGIIIFLVITVFMFFMVYGIIFPFAKGLFVGLVSGGIARDIAASLFAVRQMRFLDRDLDQLLDHLRLNRLDFSTAGESIDSIFDMIGRLYSFMFVGNWLIIVGSIALGVLSIIWTFKYLEDETK